MSHYRQTTASHNELLHLHQTANINLKMNQYIPAVRNGARIKYKLMGFMVYF
jgi:hypothetical protein